MSSRPYKTQFIRQTSLRSILFLFVILWAIGVLPWLPFQSSVVQARGECIPSGPTPSVFASAKPDLGGASPTVLVTVGTVVHVSGVAEQVQVLADCETKEKPLHFTWHVSFQPIGQLPVDTTVSLQGTTSLTPTFPANQVGTYFAHLLAGGESAEIRIEALRRGRSWYSIGPNGSIGNDGTGYTAVGRVNALAFDPANPGTLYAGSALGGVWKSLDDGGSWFPMSDHKGLPILGVTALAVAPDPQHTVYVGTGEADNMPQPGSGIWKSIDGGVTWNPAGTTATTDCPAFTGTAWRILINPQNPAILYVAATEGLFRSTNGGGCWKQLITLRNGVGVRDIAMDPTTPTTLYIASPQVSTGIFKTMNAEDAFPMFTPMLLPVDDNYDRIALAVAPSLSSTVYAALSVNGHTDVIKTFDGGVTWQKEQPRCGLQCDSHMALGVSPSDPNRVVYGEVNVWQSTNGAQSWGPLGGASCLPYQTFHCDFHAFAFDPNELGMLYAATDGGVYRITLPTSNSPTPSQIWEPRNLDLAIAQAPGLAVGTMDPQTAAIGAWDNGTQQRLFGRTWRQIQGGDGFNVAIDAASDQTIYYNYNAGVNGQTNRFPDRANLGSPAAFVSNPYRPGELFANFPVGPPNPANNNKPTLKFLVSENTDTASPVQWHCADPAPTVVANSIALEFAPDGSYYVGLDNGVIYHFAFLASPTNIGQCGPGQTAAQVEQAVTVPPSPGSTSNTFVPVMSVDPFQPQSLYVVLPGSSGAGRVLRLSGIGSIPTFTPLAATMPTNVTFTGAIGADPLTPGVLYIGTTNGLMEGTPQRDGSYSWTVNADVPDTWITGIVAQRNANGYSGVLRVTTYGRGVRERHMGPPISCLFSCVRLASGTGICISCPYRAEDFGPLHRKELRLAEHMSWIAVPYSYKGEGGSHALIRVTPLINTAEQPYFLSRVQQVDIGDGVATIPLIYAANNAPLGLHTDALRIELLKTDSTVITSTTVHFDKWWLRPEARLLTVDAEGLDEPSASSTEGADVATTSIPIPLRIQVNQSSPMMVHAPFTMPVPVGAKVTVQADLQFKMPQDTRYISQWIINGTIVSTEPIVTFTITDDTALVASYTNSSPKQPPGSGLPDWLKILLLILVLLALLLLAWVLIRLRRHLKKMHM